MKGLAWGVPAACSAAAVVLGLMGRQVFQIARARSRRATRRCPKCGSLDVRESWSEGFRDRFFDLFACVPWRCRACRTRFYRRDETAGNTAAGAA